MENNVKKGIVVAWGELFLKSAPVQKMFKKKLVSQISFYLNCQGIEFKIFPFYDRLFIETDRTTKAMSLLRNIFGIAWFSQAMFFEKANLKNIAGFVSKNYSGWIGQEESFAIRLQKGSAVKEASQDIIREITRSIKRKVNLDSPKREIFVESRQYGYFLYFKKRKGKKGLPLGASGRALSLISGGIDSPVAAYLIAKRGVYNIWLHFHSFPLVSRNSINKVNDLAAAFLKFQPGLKVYFFPFSEIQAEIKAKTEPKYRILLYRRAMFKIAEKIAAREKCSALITGESLGQVSSQTLLNMRITSSAVSMPVLRPLIARDKEEITGLARKIKTFDISIEPQEDCCTLFAPKKASAEGDLKAILLSEKKINLKQLIDSSFKGLEIKQFTP